MSKGIKKRGKITLIIVACILLLLASPFILLNISKVQVFVINKVTQALETKLETNIEIKGVNYKLFNQLELDSVLIEDQQQDTLLFAESLGVHVSIISLFHREFKLYKGSIDHAIGNVVTYPDGSNNIQFIITAFKSPKKNTPFNLSLQDVTMSQSQLSYLDLRGDTTLQHEHFNSKHIELSRVNLNVRFFKEGTNLFGNLNRLSFIEQSGFEIKELSTEFQMNDTSLTIPTLTLITSNSHIELKNIGSEFDSLKNLKAQLPSIGIHVEWLPSKIYLPDFKYFSPTLANLHNPANFKGKLSGTIGNIKLSKIIASMGSNLSINGDMEINGLPQWKNAFIFGSINALTFNIPTLQDLIANISKRPVQLPKDLFNLGNCDYSGKITGFIDNLVLYGTLKTDIGTLTTDVSFDSKNDYQDFLIKGAVRSNQLRLGKLFPTSGLGNVTFQLKTELKTGTHTPFSTKAIMNVPLFTYQNYTYHDIKVNGQFEGKEFIGKAVIDDENGYVDFEGQIDLDKENRTFKFNSNIVNLNPYKLNLLTSLPNLNINATIASNFSGTRLENMAGQITIDQLMLNNQSDTFKMNHFNLIAIDSTEYKVKLKSDLINGELEGHYALSTIGRSARTMIGKYLPIFIPKVDYQAKQKPNNVINFSFVVAPLQDLCQALNVPWYTTNTTELNGYYDDQKGVMNFEVNMPTLTNGKQYVNDIYLYCNNTNDLSVHLKGNAPLRKDTLYTVLDIKGNKDIVSTSLRWDNNNDSNLFAGEFLANTRLYKNRDTLNASVKIEHTEFTFQNKPWTINQSVINTNFNTFDIKKLNVFSDNQQLAINGIVSKNPWDSVTLNLININLDFINDLIPKMSTSFRFGGDVTGRATVASALHQPRINADIEAQNFSFNNCYLGSAQVESRFDVEQKSLNFYGKIFNDDKDTTAILDGNYFISNDSLDIVAKANHLNMGFIEYYLQGIFDEVRGYGTGDVHIYGITKSKKVAVDADAYLENAALSIGFIKTTYYFSDTLHLNKYGIKFNDIELHDKDGNKGVLTGDISFNYFKNVKFNIDIHTDKLLVLNTTKQDFSTFYGNAYASGLVSITGTDKNVRLSCRATTERGTRVFIPIDSYYASDNSFITYVSHEEDDEAETISIKYVTPSKTNLFIDLMLDVNTNAAIQLIIDTKSGDMIKATGNGNLKITFDMLTSDFKMYGTYKIDKGEYLFTFQNVIRKYFHVKEGSSLTWTGNPLEPTIDINAYYQLTASLVDILDEATLSNASRSSVPVQCILNLSGNLMQPTIKFDIDLPNSDEDLNRALKNAINTDEQMNRQIIGLLLLGKFINPNSYQNTSSLINSNELFSVVSSTLSSQLNSWASQLFENWNFGVNFRTSGEGETRSNEYELNFLYTPNNRIIINGNVGYRDDNLSSTKIIGDFDIEYKLNRSGKLRAKAYTHTNDYKEFKKGLTTQGIGLVYRESFSSLPQLWQSWKDAIANNKKERAIRKEERTKKKALKQEQKEKEKAEKNQ